MRARQLSVPPRMSALAAEAVGYVGHRCHVIRRREVGTLLEWAGDLNGRRLLDVGGGDGYWAAAAAGRGAEAACLDLSRPKLLRGKRLVDPPYLVEGDALALPFRDGAFDVVLSVCAIEHFPDGAAALAEMARVLRPGGDLVLSADALTREQEWPELARKHRQRYAVRATYDVHRLQEMLEALGMTLLKHTYLFRSRSAEYLYLTLSARGGRYGWNAAAPVAPVMRFADARVPDESGSVLLVHARAAD